MSLLEKITKMNKNLNGMKTDFLYHLGINIANTADTSNVAKQFGDVKFVCMGGTKSRMSALAKHIRKLIRPKEVNDNLVDLCEAAGRYAVYKVGPVLCCSHGIGMPSMSILVHEMIKLVAYAKCVDPIFIRVGTCGGLGVPAGTVVVTELAYNGFLKNEHEIAILGQSVKREAKFNPVVCNDIVECGKCDDKFLTVKGNTMAADCFYEGQGRIDGASCSYALQDKIDFLKRCHNECGIKNIEMEATMFSSLTLHVGVKAADVCVTLVDRLITDQVTITKEEKESFEERPLIIIGRYIKNSLN